MISAPLIAVIAFSYLGLLFAIARYGDRQADAGRSIIAHPIIYALSLAVYCTSWTFYGSVGRAATGGVEFLPVYLGPTLMFLLGWSVLRKIIRISKENRITSIADFIASRYGKSFELGILVSIIALVGILPYISLQLKAISTSAAILLDPPVRAPPSLNDGPSLPNTELYLTLAMAVFVILYGTRQIDASERHEGMVAAVAFESIVKFVAFLAVGLFVVHGLYSGSSDIYARAAANEVMRKLFTIEGTSGLAGWAALLLLSTSMIIVLPRQFQLLVVECVDERYLRTAVWLFPLYLLLINFFVLPIAFAGLLLFRNGGVNADMFVLLIPLEVDQKLLALLVFIGGLSAATGMIIVETIAIATMISNDLVMPLLLRVGRSFVVNRSDLTGLVLAIRRGTILIVLLLGYGFVITIGESYALVTIGLVSFVAAMQFAPAILAGIYWRAATKAGALAALIGGFAVWLYTLLVPALARSGWMDASFIENGPCGLWLLRPYALFGLEGFDEITHATVWTLVANVGLLVGVSLVTTQSTHERSQAVRFVDVFRRAEAAAAEWRGRVSVKELRDLLVRFVGEPKAGQSLARLEAELGRQLQPDQPASSEIVRFVERQLAGAIGAASARIMVASVLRDEIHDIDQVTRLLDEATQLVVYARELEEKSRALEATGAELRAANAQLKELDKLKDDFMATVSHEIRTPLTSIRSFGEILRDHPDLDTGQRQEFVGIIVKESERLSRLINDILDLAKLEAGTTMYHLEMLDAAPLLESALAAASGLFAGAPHVRLETDIAEDLPPICVDRDRFTQVVVNLVSNAVKACDKAHGWVKVRAWNEAGQLRVDVADNGKGIAAADHERIFERFQQAGDTLVDKPHGTGLGLAICRQILRAFGGTILVESELGKGSVFSFRVPTIAPSS
jgi:Na+/proline symporter/nitrogen-specific signal transduction histidine kinase